ncbi:hypothetical protein QLL95_gp0398 [Cotonvirus japonicus]|uniref:Uncharacterized protein n=1 Tax=Cotonvirus japonicus TaxID=2811091 RepID=A0ABM7NU76_9VIRU|nr:hypothetical protein QLL95_gp0398 [Cotonvirus japonicus]BCS83725.1 hypothetical protein [Cotonvirus japonicus]
MDDFEETIHSMGDLTREEKLDKLLDIISDDLLQNEKIYAKSPYKLSGAWSLPIYDIKGCADTGLKHLSFRDFSCEKSVEEIISNLVNVKTYCNKYRKSFINGRCVVKIIGITRKCSWHLCKYGKLQKNPQY